MCNRENRQVIWCSYLEIDVLVFICILFIYFQYLLRSVRCRNGPYIDITSALNGKNASSSPDICSEEKCDCSGTALLDTGCTAPAVSLMCDIRLAVCSCFNQVAGADLHAAAAACTFILLNPNTHPNASFANPSGSPSGPVSSLYTICIPSSVMREFTYFSQSLLFSG